MKKFFLLLALVFLLAACGKNEQNETEENVKKEKEKEINEVEEKEVEPFVKETVEETIKEETEEKLDHLSLYEAKVNVIPETKEVWEKQKETLTFSSIFPKEYDSTHYVVSKGYKHMNVTLGYSDEIELNAYHSGETWSCELIESEGAQILEEKNGITYSYLIEDEEVQVYFYAEDLCFTIETEDFVLEDIKETVFSLEKKNEIKVSPKYEAIKQPTLYPSENPEVTELIIYEWDEYDGGMFLYEFFGENGSLLKLEIEQSSPKLANDYGEKVTLENGITGFFTSGYYDELTWYDETTEHEYRLMVKNKEHYDLEKIKQNLLDIANSMN